MTSPQIFQIPTDYADFRRASGHVTELKETALTALRQRPYQVQLTPDAPTSESIRTRYAVSPSRAPAGRHTAWAYCHVPNGSEKDCTELIERQIARLSPNSRVNI